MTIPEKIISGFIFISGSILIATMITIGIMLEMNVYSNHKNMADTVDNLKSRVAVLENRL